MQTMWMAALTLLAAGCSSGEAIRTSQPSQTPDAMRNVQVSGPSAAREYGDLEPWNGMEISLTGTFRAKDVKAKHGILTLASGLKVSIPHFDQFRIGEDWLKYNGRVCTATGMLHTYTRNIDGYRMPTLQLTSFSGP